MIGVVNGFRLKGKRRQDDKWNIDIIYMQDGKRLPGNPSHYEGVEEEKVIRIQNFLKDNTEYNRLKAQFLCEIVPIEMLISEVQYIIEN